MAEEEPPGSAGQAAALREPRQAGCTICRAQLKGRYEEVGAEVNLRAAGASAACLRPAARCRRLYSHQMPVRRISWKVLPVVVVSDALTPPALHPPQRFRVCQAHRIADAVQHGGRLQRFCQQVCAQHPALRSTHLQA